MSDSFPSLVLNGKVVPVSIPSSTGSVVASTAPTCGTTDVANKIQPPLEMQPTSETQEELHVFWEKQLKDVEEMDSSQFKVQDLPLARIKKIMKMDEDVKMISAEAPLLFAKAAQMFITELSLRAWIHTEENKRRTLQRNDIATAISKFDQFDFLIDIVPREELKPTRRSADETKTSGENLQYFYSVPQQSSQPATNQASTQTSSAAPGQVVITSGGQTVQLSTPNQSLNGEGAQQILTQQQVQQQAQPNNNSTIGNTPSQPTGVVIGNQSEPNQTVITPQIIQQLISNSGASPSEIQSIQITPDGQVQIIKNPGVSENL